MVAQQAPIAPAAFSRRAISMHLCDLAKCRPDSDAGHIALVRLHAWWRCCGPYHRGRHQGGVEMLLRVAASPRRCTALRPVARAADTARIHRRIPKTSEVGWLLPTYDFFIRVVVYSSGCGCIFVLAAPRRPARRGRSSMTIVVIGAGAVGAATAWYLAKARPSRRRGRAPAGGRARDQLGQWLRHPCGQRGRALVADWHAAEDHRLARRGECAAAAALWRDPENVAVGARFCLRLQPREVQAERPRQSRPRAPCRCARCTRSAPRPASPMTGPPRAS